MYFNVPTVIRLHSTITAAGTDRLQSSGIVWDCLGLIVGCWLLNGGVKSKLGRGYSVISPR